MSVRRLHLDLAQQAIDRYLPVPFDVAPGAASLEVSLRLDRRGNAIDVGLEGPAGFRGWSGAARDHVVITAAAATPGYLPGAPEPGRWSVILGLHWLPEAGVDVAVETLVPAVAEIEAPRLAPVVETVRGSARDLPAPPGLAWYAGDFHAHTEHSDGAVSVDELAARAAAAGLDFLAVTDHNTVSHHAVLPAAAARHRVTLIPGQEVTTHRGHANAYGDIGWVDFRRPAAEWVADVARRGGILSVNHPLDTDCAWQHPLPVRPPALELWHISWFRDLTATGPWALWHTWGEAVIIGGSDWHDPAAPWTVGTPTTWVCAADASPDAILAAVAAGRTAVSVGVRPDATVDPFGTPVLLRLGDDLIADRAQGLWLVDIDGTRRRITQPRQRIAAPREHGPYHLQDAQRWVMAICR